MRAQLTGQMSLLTPSGSGSTRGSPFSGFRRQDSAASTGFEEPSSALGKVQDVQVSWRPWMAESGPMRIGKFSEINLSLELGTFTMISVQ